MTKTHATLILDASGSMQPQLQDTRGSIISFIRDQKSIVGDECTLRVIAFSNNWVELYNGPVNEAHELAIANAYRPSGGTALLDTVGQAIDDNGKDFRDNGTYDNVLLTIITDGQENASKEYTAAQVKEKVQHQTEKYGWVITYIGAEPQVAQLQYGIVKAVQYVNGAMSVNTASRTLRGMRTSPQP